ncbi:hypothetical protein ZIOFF_075008 [Zingiber officinale]|uniref:DDE Tnp4 domain-containing protein n=1 Tax=Zingiber officinale TaxID=94328 RepID=A0A8J5EL67_ZINOF|nr:hypothetical protein ZIOFF_075008 [Zingiber officinale]
MLSNLVTDSSTAPSRNATFKSSTRTPSLSPFRNSRLLADSLPSSACSWIALAQRCRSRLIHLAAPFVGMNNYGLKPTRSVIAEEQLATFMMIDCIGAIDDTHIQASIPCHLRVPFIGKKGSLTQNVMVACDFDMCFTFVLHGWEGSAYDTRIFYSAIKDASKNFPCHIEVNII